MPNINDAFPSQFLKASDLKERAIVVVIDRVDYEPVGQKKEVKPIVYFEGKEKGLVLNKTNANKIIQLTESPITEEWVGFPITIYPTETQFAGDTVECIRVKAAPKNVKRKQPDPVPEPEPETGNIPDDDDIPF